MRLKFEGSWTFQELAEVMPHVIFNILEKIEGECRPDLAEGDCINSANFYLNFSNSVVNKYYKDGIYAIEPSFLDDIRSQKKYEVDRQKKALKGMDSESLFTGQMHKRALSLVK